jgi:salicylate 5-hydroxylase small subunit
MSAAANSTLDINTWLALQALMADYSAALDNGELQRWPELFTADAVYKVQSRENFDRGLPLATMAFESQGMLRDRVYGAAETIFHDPYSQRHIVSVPRVLSHDATGIHCETNYLVVRTHRDAMPETLSVGRYLDHIVHTEAGLRFAQRLCIFDNDLIANSLIYPI